MPSDGSRAPSGRWRRIWRYRAERDELAVLLQQIEAYEPGITRSERMPADPPEVVEIWFAN